MRKVISIPLQLLLGNIVFLFISSPILFAEARPALGEQTLSEGVPQGHNISFRAPAEHSLASDADSGSRLFLAQVTTDGTVNTQVTTDGNVTEITGGETQGSNLFHSFQDFSISTGQTAFFDNANDISNILSRVTGGNISNIDGLIRANGSANLFLINPAGIIFGKGARLDIGGSFLASTSSSILFEDGEFSAVDNLQQPMLMVNAPIGLGFRDNPGDIVNRSTAKNVGLEVLSEESINLLGGNIDLIGGKVTASDGTVNLGGLIASGEIAINNGELIFPNQVTKGNIILNNRAEINVSGNSGGAININANRLELNRNSILRAGIATDLGAPGVQADNIEISTNSIFATNDSQIRNENLGVGNAGNIDITTNTLEFSEGAIIAASTFGRGNAGNITINAIGDVSFDRDFGGIYTTVGLLSDERSVENVAGDAGNVVVNANNLSLFRGARIVTKTKGEGNAGNVNLNVAGTVLVDGIGTTIVPFFLEEFDVSLAIDSAILTQVAQGGIGDGGNININAQNFIARNTTTNALVQDFNNALIAADNQGGIGDSGNITINATDLILLDRGLILTELGETPDSFLNNPTFAEGTGGDIVITTGSLDLKNKSNIASRTQAIGNAGNIEITVFDLTLTNNSIFESSTSGQGNAGNIIIDATRDVRFEGDFSGILSQVRSEGVGKGGNIKITAGDAIAINDSSILLANVSDRSRGNAGNITLNAENISVSESLVLSQIQDEAVGNAGGINFVADTINIGNFSLISSNAQIKSFGAAGNISFDGARIVIDGGAIVDALTENSFDGGNINLNGGSLAVVSGGAVATSTDSDGNAGNIRLNFTGDITIDGAGMMPRSEGVFQLREQTLIDLQESTGLFATSSADSTGNGGNIQSNNPVGNFIVSNSGIVSVDSEGGGDGGILAINTNSLDINNQGEITAFTTSGSGGNINLMVNDLIRLNNNALISAEAFKQANGGNINIDTNFIIAFLNQTDGNGSDIIANSAQGNGGRIDINAESLLGISETRAIAGNQINNIDASSEFGLDGTVSIFTPDTNTLERITELPQKVISIEQTNSQACADQNSTAQNSFIIRGKGSIQPNPGMPLNTYSLLSGQSASTDRAEITPISTGKGKIVAARGAIAKPNGDIILTSRATHNTSASDSQFINCN